MNHANPRLPRLAAALLALATLLPVGCSSTPATGPDTQSATAPVADDTQPGSPGENQPLYATDVDAANALLAAVNAADHDQIHAILGPASLNLSSGDKVEDANAFKVFADRATQQNSLQKHPDGPTILVVGDDHWPFPIPIAQTADGKWFFDTASGKIEILARRIGQNELDAIAFCRAFVTAQNQYFAHDHEGYGVLKYAQRILSTPDHHDGLYWQDPTGNNPSPFSATFEAAAKQGYGQTTGTRHQPIHGYRFRVLKRQGPDAPGGQLDYIVKGDMTAGFALVCFPEKYEYSGIMTFIVSRDGKLYQKDLGPQTAELARQMTEYNPDDSWTLVKD